MLASFTFLPCVEMMRTMYYEPERPDMESKTFQPTALAYEQRTTLPTAEAAFHLNRAQQTLRIWACRENGPIRPVRVNSRLAWRVADIKQLLGGV